MTPAADADYQQLQRTIAELQVENERLKAEVENLIWNLAGCDTYAMGYGLDTDHDKESARPALESCRRMALENKRLREQVRTAA